MSTSKAIVTQVPFGSVSIEGLMLPDGSFGISVSQAAKCFSFDTNQASRKVKSLLGEGFQFDTTKSELNSKAVNFLTLPQFELLMTKLDRAGNKQAQELRDSLVGLSLQQLFSDAFGVRFEAEDRQKWLSERQRAKSQHQPCLTDKWNKLDGICTQGEYIGRTYQMKAAAGIPTKTSVNDMTTNQLERWTMAQSYYNTARELGADHRKALDLAKQVQVIFAGS